MSYYSEVRWLGFLLSNHEVFEYQNLENAFAAESMILRIIRPVFRCGCRVYWIDTHFKNLKLRVFNHTKKEKIVTRSR